MIVPAELATAHLADASLNAFPARNLGKAQQKSRMIVPEELATTHLADASLNAFPARSIGLSGGIDAAAMLYCVFPFESSAKRNKKAVQRTAFLLYQRPFVNKFPRSQTQQKPLLRVAFLLRSALVIPAVKATLLV